MNGVLITCSDCHQPVEALMLADAVPRFMATQPFADSHYERYQHYPERVHVTSVDPRSVSRLGRRWAN